MCRLGSAPPCWIAFVTSSLTSRARSPVVAGESAAPVDRTECRATEAAPPCRRDPREKGNGGRLHSPGADDTHECGRRERTPKRPRIRRYAGGRPGAVAEWLRTGLQSRLHRFDSVGALVVERDSSLASGGMSSPASPERQPSWRRGNSPEGPLAAGDRGRGLGGDFCLSSIAVVRPRRRGAPSLACGFIAALVRR